jgi:hypothetical protein
MKSTWQCAIGVVALILLSACTGTPASSDARPTTAGTAQPSATPQPTSSVSAITPAVTSSEPVATAVPTAPTAVPEALRFRWIGPLRDVPGFSPPTNFSGLKFSAKTTSFYPYTSGDGPDLGSTTSSPSGDQLSFVTVADGAGCDANDAGKYTYALDAAKTHLRLTSVNDDCEARAIAFSGDWTRSTCQESQGWCLGSLGAGEYQSAVFTPFTPAANWKYDYGEMSYTVPSGWSNPEDTPSGYRLEQEGAHGSAIYVFADMLAHSQAADCRLEPDPAVGTSATELTQWLTELPSIVSTKPEPVTIGGLSGSMLDVSLDPSWTRTCDYSEGMPAAPLFSNADPDHGFDWAVVGAERMRLFVLSLPDDRNLVVDIDSIDEQAWDAFVPQAMPVVESFAFSR